MICQCIVPVTSLRTIGSLKTALEALPSLHFIAVFGGFTERERSALQALQAQHPHLSLINTGAFLGRGAALRAGVGAATAEFIAILDPEGFVDFDVVMRAIAKLENVANVDAVIGNRWAASSSYSLRRLLSSAYAGFARALFRLPYRDLQSPFKLFRRRVLTATFEELRLFSTGFDVELLFRLRRRGLRAVDMPINWREVSRTDLTIRGVFQTLVALLVIRLSHGSVARASFLDLLGRHFIIPAKRSYSILIFAWRDPSHPGAGGGEAYLYEQARNWIRSGHSVTWVCQRFAGASKTQTIEGIRYERVASVPWIFIAGAIWYVFRSQKNFDFVIDCMNGIPFFTPLFTTKPKVALVYHIHAKHFREELRWPLSLIAVNVESKLVPFIYRNTSFVTISESTKRDMQARNMSRFPITLIHSGVSDELKPAKKHPRPTVLYLGRIRRYKRVLHLINAFQKVKRAVPDARLVIAGTGDDEPFLKEHVRSENISDVEFAGRVTDEEKSRLMSEAWVFGMPSSLEGWGIVVIEANAAGTPAVGYNVGGLRDCIVHGETGLLVQNESEFADALRSVLVDPMLRGKLEKGCVAWASQFSWQNSSARTLDQLRAAQPWKGVFEPEPSGAWKVYGSTPRVKQVPRRVRNLR